MDQKRYIRVPLVAKLKIGIQRIFVQIQVFPQLWPVILVSDVDR